MQGGRSAVLIEVPAAEPVVGAWRAEHDPVAPGVPAHVTLLFPFRSPETLDAAVLDSVRAVAAATPAFDFALTSIGEFDGVIWLLPEPEQRFLALTHALFGAFPDCPPYEGRHEKPQPHLTIAHVNGDRQADLRRAIERDIGDRLPIETTATDLSVLCSDATESAWHEVARFTLDG